MFSEEKGHSYQWVLPGTRLLGSRNSPKSCSPPCHLDIHLATDQNPAVEQCDCPHFVQVRSRGPIRAEPCSQSHKKKMVGPGQEARDSGLPDPCLIGSTSSVVPQVSLRGPRDLDQGLAGGQLNYLRHPSPHSTDGEWPAAAVNN